MKNLLTIFCICILVYQAMGQGVTKRDFYDTEWFSDNLDSLFYKSDTIYLIKYSNIVSKDLGFNEYAESEQDLLHHGYYVKCQFNKNHKMLLWNIEYEYSTKAKIGERRWEFLKNENILIIYKENIIEFKMKLIQSKEIEIKSGYTKINGPIKTFKLTMVKIK